MPGFEDIIGQNKSVGLLKAFLRNAKLPHALLFTGLPGIGKRTIAKSVAMALNCRDNKDSATPCGQCQPCRQITSDNHPDMIIIEPQGKYLRISQIRNLLSKLAMKPYTAEHRVVIIADAHDMNQEAANALLKILEEPPLDTILILTAQQQTDLLPTIVSRCRHIRFRPLADDEIITLLKETKEVDECFYETAAALSGGSFTKAQKLATAFWRDQRNWLIHASGLDEPIQEGKRPIAAALAFASQLALKKERMTELLGILQTWIRDLSIWPYRPESAINSDYIEVLKRVRPSMDDQYLLTLWNAVENAEKSIEAKANMRLTLDTMALRMAGYPIVV